MKKPIKDLWVKALLSGEFRQGKYRLEKDGKYCVLGVLSVLALSEGICTYGNRGTGSYDKRLHSLSFNVQDWSGIRTSKAEITLDDGTKTTLADLNDSGKSFKELAKIIEEYWDEI